MHTNTECQKAVLPIHNTAKTSTDLIKVCQNIGSEKRKATGLAAALVQQLTVARASVKCFACSQGGHEQRDCPTRKDNCNQKEPEDLCPRCRKGYHWSEQSLSNFDKDGCFIPGNRRRGTRPRAPQATGSVLFQHLRPPECHSLQTLCH